MEIIAKDGMNGFDAAEQAGLKKEALVVRVNGEVKELWQPLHEGDQGRGAHLRRRGRPQGVPPHGHLTCWPQAVKHLRPGDQAAPSARPSPTASTMTSTSTNPLPRRTSKTIEKEMQQDHQEKRNAWSASSCPAPEALELMQGIEPYKVELINDLPEDEVISFYTQGDFTDLCAGPHLAHHRQGQGLQAHAALPARTGAATETEQDARSAFTAPRSPTRRSWTRYLPAHGRGQEARPPQARQRARSVHAMMDEGPGFPFFLPKGMVLQQHADRLLARDPHKRRL